MGRDPKEREDLTVMNHSGLLLQFSIHLNLFGLSANLRSSKLRHSGSAETVSKTFQKCPSHSSTLSGWTVTVTTSVNPSLFSCCGNDIVFGIFEAAVKIISNPQVIVGG